MHLLVVVGSSSDILLDKVVPTEPQAPATRSRCSQDLGEITSRGENLRCCEATARCRDGSAPAATLVRWHRLPSLELHNVAAASITLARNVGSLVITCHRYQS